MGLFGGGLLRAELGGGNNMDGLQNGKLRTEKSRTGTDDVRSTFC